MTPELTSARLVLVPYTRQRVTETHVSWLNNKELMRFSEQRYKTHTLRTQYAYLDGFPRDSYIWLIRCGRDDIGTITAHVDTTNKVANLGVLIGDSLYQGGGYGAEAWATVTDWLFSKAGVRKTECGTRADNWPMRRIAVSTGMDIEGVIHGHFLTETGAQGLVVYGRFASDKHESDWSKMWKKPYWGENGTVAVSS